MNDAQTYLIWAYVISITLLWGYALLLWFDWYNLKKKSQSKH